MTFETKSRNTWENALFTRALIKPQTRVETFFLLVTAAWHMPRAMGVFRKLGYRVIAYPTDYMTLGDRRDFCLFISASANWSCLNLRCTNGSA